MKGLKEDLKYLTDDEIRFILINNDYEKYQTPVKEILKYSLPIQRQYKLSRIRKVLETIIIENFINNE